MPVLPQVAPYGQVVCKVSGQHSVRRPPVNEPCVDSIGSVRHPDRAEMGAVFIGGVVVFLELKTPRSHALQEPPVGFVAKLWEVADRILRLSNCRALVGADTSGDGLIDPVPRFHRLAVGGRVLAVALDAHGRG